MIWVVEYKYWERQTWEAKDKKDPDMWNTLINHWVPLLAVVLIKPLPWACGQSRKKSKSCNKCCSGEDGWHQVLFCLGFSFGLLSLPSWRSWRSVNYAGRSQVFYWLSRSIWIRPSPPATPLPPNITSILTSGPLTASAQQSHHQAFMGTC